MFQNYVTTALRNLRRHFGYASINLVGLALGLTVTLQIFLFVQSELSYDTFHADAENLYRVTLEGSFSGTDLNAPISPAPMAVALVNDFPEVVSATRLFTFQGEKMVRKGDNEYLDDGIIRADSSFFEVLTFPLLQGDSKRALTRPSTVVLTQSMATKLFGSYDPMGESIIMGDSTRYEVTGVVADPPSNSHIQFSILESMTGFGQAESSFWVSNNFFTYLKLQDGTTAEEFEAKLPSWYKQYAGPQIEAAFGKSYDEMLTGQNRSVFHLIARLHQFHESFDGQIFHSGDRSWHPESRWIWTGSARDPIPERIHSDVGRRHGYCGRSDFFNYTVLQLGHRTFCQCSHAIEAWHNDYPDCLRCCRRNTGRGLPSTVFVILQTNISD